MTVKYHIDSLDATDQLGREIAATLRSGDTVCLSGTLGAGKTRLVQAIAVAFGVPSDHVVSPTFTLCNEYLAAEGHDDTQGSRLGQLGLKLQHLDLYRVNDEDELLELGFDEYCDSDGITLVEWADRFPDSLPARRLDVIIEVIGEHERTVELLDRRSL